MPKNDKNNSRNPSQSEVTNISAKSGPPDANNKKANQSSVSRVESGGTGSSAGELGIDPQRLKGE